ncbi:MAG: helix-turn-helix domain-containing protein [Pseudomonadales bacterium]|nr:helix-turn-helix domain-containing protein [Pseudomonadales bacterium]
MKKRLHIHRDHALFMGNFGIAQPHRHGALVLLIGLSGSIRVQLEGNELVCCRSALIDANVNHMVDCVDEHVATLYFEIDSLYGRQLRQTFLQKQHAVFDIIRTDSVHSGYTNRLITLELETILKHPLTDPTDHIDLRIANCIQLLQQDYPRIYTQTDISNQLGLSNSRLNHLFKQQTGLDFRHFRLWSKLASFMRDVQSTRQITSSAVNSGFSDSAHLSNAYRKMFGISPSTILTKLDEFLIID